MNVKTVNVLLQQALKPEKQNVLDAEHNCVLSVIPANSVSVTHEGIT